MKVIEFHPDDLLDREIEGTLSPGDQRRLREHLERCKQCQLERQLRFDFEAELGSHQDATNIQSFVTGALRAAGSSATRRSARPKAVNVWRRRFVFLLAATMVLATGLAAAEVEFTGRAIRATREKIAFLFHLEAPAPTSMPVPAAAPARVEEPTNVAAAIPSPIAVEPSEPSAPPAPAIDRPLPSIAPHRAPVEKARVASAEPAQRAFVEVENPTPRDSASALFEDASAARRGGRMLEAAALYRDLEARFPASPEARLSMAVVARMELDQGETAAAASGFAAYLATGDRALREEAMAGRAIALGRLGRTEDEATAWRDLLHAYPSSSYAKVARTRLGQDSP
jgi:TolA-binding protein